MVAAMAAKLPFLVLFWFFLPEFLPGNATNLLDPAGRWCFNLDDFDAKFDDISDDNWLKLSKWNAGPTNNAFLPLPLGTGSDGYPLPYPTRILFLLPVPYPEKFWKFQGSG